jgi:hypothetical protein
MVLCPSFGVVSRQSTYAVSSLPRVTHAAYTRDMTELGRGAPWRVCCAKWYDVAAASAAAEHHLHEKVCLLSTLSAEPARAKTAASDRPLLLHCCTL